MFRQLLVIAVAAAGLVSAIAGPCVGLDTGEYVIYSRASGKVLTVDPSMFSENGANIMQWEYQGANHQVWRVEHIGNSEFKIINRENGLCLEVATWDKGSMVALDEGANVRQWEYVAGDNQKWRIEWVEGEYYRLTNVRSGMCLDVQGSYHYNGANVYQWGCHTGHNQQWKLERWGAIKIIDVQWVPYSGGYLNVEFDSFPAWNGGSGWKFYLDGVELPMDGGAGYPCIRPNGPVESATGVYIATVPWLTGLNNVNFPCAGIISFSVPQHGFTNAYAYDLSGSGCTTAATAQTSSGQPEGEIGLGVDF